MKARALAILLAFALGAGAGALVSSSLSDTAPPRSFAGARVVFFCGGSPGDSFAEIVHTGARAAARDLGCELEVLWSGWNRRKMADQLKDAIATRPDAICVMGHPGLQVLAPLVEEARAAGIVVTILNVDVPELRARHADAGLGYVGQKLFASGHLLATVAAEKFTLPKGAKAVVLGVVNEDRGQRTQGCLEALRERGLEVVLVPIPEGLDATGPPGEALIRGALRDHPDLRLLVTDHGALTAEVAEVLIATGRKPGELAVAGFDLSPGSLAGLESEHLSLVLDQQPFLQGYLPVLQGCLSSRYGFSGLNVDTSSGLIDKTLAARLSDHVRAQVR